MHADYMLHEFMKRAADAKKVIEIHIWLVSDISSWAQLFKGWLTLSTG